MFKLYGSGASRWVKPYWLLKELDVPFEACSITLSKGEHKQAEFLRMNPFGKVPALQDGDKKLFESAAICNYLADKFPEKGLIPRVGTFDRALYDQWISFTISELEQPLWRIIKHRYIYPESKRIPADIELAQDDFGRILTILESQIVGPYLVGGRFSVADIAMSYTLQWASLPSMPPGLLQNFPAALSYLNGHKERASFPKELFYPQAK